MAERGSDKSLASLRVLCPRVQGSSNKEGQASTLFTVACRTCRDPLAMLWYIAYMMPGRPVVTSKKKAETSMDWEVWRDK
ncbi:hypothetical protein HZ326_20444 [Fusarium oxysporum f. sp. albedinis]|nr:putative transcription factor lepB [Fusarium oxysporum f. sp. albedinis]KAJ0136537.1 hypothetical protein HZ326_20444 [Fusarium oxysporum f. sp. albedinis]